MPVSIQRSWSVVRALLAALVVVGLVAFVSTPSFAASPTPTVTAVTPNAGATAGGTTVTVTGTGFLGIAGVTVGGVPATKVVAQSSTQVTATVPAHAAGITDIRVTGALGTSAIVSADRFTYQAAPTITSVTRNFGTTAGGDSIIVKGTGFVGVSSASFASVAAGFTVVSSTQLTLTSPAQGAETVDIHVTTPYGTTAVSTADQYTYEGTPVITGVPGETPGTLAGVVAGGTIQFTGSGFIGASAVTFGGVAATGLVVNSGSLLTIKAPAHVAGPVDIAVTTPVGTSDAAAYNYEPAPVVTSLSNNQGSAAGGGSTNVLISGSGFTDASGVLFGTVASTSVTVNSNSSITASIPPHAAGLVDVHVVLGDGSSAVTTADHFTYLAIPAVTAVSPTTGALAGGSTVTITGTSFTGISAVRFGATAATIVGTPTSTKITVQAPGTATAGIVDVTVTGTYGTSAAVLADHYTYIAAPTVSALSPAAGLIAGGATLTVTGTNFVGVSKVTFNGVAGTTVVVQSPTQLTVRTPAHVAGAVAVQVVSAYGTSATSGSDLFAYSATPTITALNSTQGPIAGGDPIQITGLNLQNVTGVKFGTTVATAVTVISPNTVTATIPAHVAGVVDITVQVGAGSSAAVAADKFTYLGTPTITKITPTSGPDIGGTTVTVTGTNFGATAWATVNGNDGTNIHVLSTTSMTFVTPGGSDGIADIQVNDFGSSAIVTADRFTYEQPPILNTLSPSAGVLGGGNVITITGANFVGVSKVYFGTTASTKVTTTSSTKLTVTVPAHVVGAVDVTVVATYGTSEVTPFDQYNYEPIPTVTGVTPGAGAPAGLTPVTITGINFLGTAKVEFGTTLATNVLVVDETTITATIPAHIAGTVDVRVVGQYGTSPVGAADHYLYQSAGSIGGTVSAGTSQAGIQVAAFNGNGDLAGTTFTGATGAYVLGGLGGGNYTLDFSPADPSYAPQWYGGTALKSAATPISLLAGQVLTGKNVALSASGTIHGRVTDGSNGLTDVNLLAYDADGIFAGSTTTDGNGAFDILGLSAGVYTLEAMPQSGTVDATTYAPTWDGGVLTQAGSTSVVVTTGAVSATETIPLIAGGSISGTVTGPGSTEVDVYDSTGDSVASTVTDSGAYRIGGLATGVYKVKFVAVDATTAPQWYDGTGGGAALESRAAGVSVTAGAESTDVNASLAIESYIFGEVSSSAGGSGIPGVEVSAYDADGNWVGGAVTDGDGFYSIFGLAEGSYTVSFTPGTDAFAPQWWNGASSQATASAVNVPFEFTSEADAMLTPTSSISGTVLGSGTTIVPIAGASVVAYDLAGNEIERATTDAFGNYSLSGLQSGSYKLEFVPGDSPFGPRWWNGAPSVSTATVIALTAGESLAGTNITLTGASISGAVTGAGGVPLSGVRVYAVDAAGNGIAQTTTNSIGHYALTGVTPGSYTLEFVAATGADYATQWWTGKPTEAGATFISLTAGLAISGKNVALASTDGSISGTVTDATAGGPVASIAAYAYDAGGNLTATAYTDSSGNYTVAGLPAGSYTVFVSHDAAFETNYVNQWYGNKSTEATATPIAVAAATAVTGKDVALVENGSISGTVFDVDDGATGLANVDVEAFDSAGDDVSSTDSNPDGTYTLPGLAAGSYALEFSTEFNPFAPSWYANATSFATADKIAVTPGVDVVGKNVTLGHGSSITGTVTVPSPVAAESVEVNVYDSTGFILRQISADHSGAYSFTDLAPGTYTLDFIPNFNSENWWYGQSSYGAQLTVKLQANQDDFENPVVLTTAGTVSGTITDTSATPVSGISVNLEDVATGAYLESNTGTDSSGQFDFSMVPDGTYELFVDDPSENFVSQTTEPFTLAGGDNAPIENVTLLSGASISGSLFGADDPSDALGDIEVDLEDSAGNFVASDDTDPTTDLYSFTGLPAGTYRVVAKPDEDGYATMSISGITLSAGQSQTGEDMVLPLSGGIIQGSVVAEGIPGAPLGGVFVEIFDSAGTNVVTGETDDTGAFAISGIPDGTYTIEFQPPQDGFEPMWWKGATSEADATPVTLAPGDEQATLNAVLNQGATISGSVFTAGTPNQAAAFFEVDVYDTGGNLVSAVSTNAVGSYTTEALIPGKYTLNFIAPIGGGNESFAGQWLGGGSTEAGAATITVLGAQQVTGENAVLAKAGSISGTVVDATGHALDSISVPVWMLVGGTYVPLTSAFTDGNGNYSLDGLGAGSYKIGFSDYASGDGSSNTVFGNQYWNAAPTLGSATPIVLTAGQAAGGKNATMTKISALANLTATPTPTIKGTTKSGSVLTATPGTWAPATVVLTYQWDRGGTVIDGATAATYKLTAADVGQQVTVVVTGQKVGYKTASKTSAATALVSG
ncbi:MAG TPA: IPT/TIG domain-containing protein [Galbitalea sp.]|nr:IPT/TIG domain-containing protein [Galbitalea sp.]